MKPRDEIRLLTRWLLAVAVAGLATLLFMAGVIIGHCE